MKKYVVLATVLCLSMTLFGCGQKEEESLVVIDNEDESISYGLIPVTVDDVILRKNLTCVYTQTQEQAVSFPAGGKKIAKVHVRAGDHVSKGDLLVELEDENLGSQIDELEYEIAKNQLMMEYLETAQDFEKRSTYYNFAYHGGAEDEEELEEYEKSQTDIDRSYLDRKEDFLDDLEFDQKKLAKVNAELAGKKIYSTMDGTVLGVTPNLEGSTSKKDQVIITVVDESSGMFEINEPGYAQYFHEGDILDMKVVYSGASGDYELTPYQMNTWEDKQMFSIVSAPETEGLEVGVTGTLTLILDQRSQVLSLPSGCVFFADEKPYVYVLDENNFRQIQWIEIGLVGSDKIEITGGLSEGDKVIYR